MNVKRFEAVRGKCGCEQRRTAPRVRLDRDAWGQLVLIGADGQLHTGIEPVRAFPFSDSERWVSLRDGEWQELLLIQDLAALDARSRAVLEDELAQREFVPVIRRIRHISALTEPAEWVVDTDRGMTRFVLDGEDDVHSLRGRRVLIVDANRMRYLIPDARTLDATSRRMLERYI